MENNETNVPRIIAMANMKGGVGKTTSTIGTAIALTRLGRKVEVRDIDPQGSATLWAAKARTAGEPLPFDVRVTNRFTVGMPPADPEAWVLIDTPPSQSDLIAAAVDADPCEHRRVEERRAVPLGPRPRPVRRDHPVQGGAAQVERIRTHAVRERIRPRRQRTH